MVMEDSVRSALTVISRLALLVLSLSEVAMIVALPALTPVMRPSLLTVAMAGLLEDHVTPCGASLGLTPAVHFTLSPA